VINSYILLFFKYFIDHAKVRRAGIVSSKGFRTVSAITKR